MSNTLSHQSDPARTVIYQIRVKGHLDAEWTTWFEGLTITREDSGETLITGPVRDQAALYGLLKKVRNLGLPLISVNCLEREQIDDTEIPSGPCSPDSNSTGSVSADFNTALTQEDME